MRKSVVFNAGNYRRCPRVIYPRRDLSDLYPAVIYPVYHIVGGKYHKRFDMGVVIRCSLFRLLLVVRAVNVKPSVIFHRGGIGAEYVRRDGICVTLVFVDISAYLVDYYSVVKAVDYCFVVRFVACFRFAHTVYAVGRAFCLHR